MWDWLACSLIDLLIELAPADTLSTIARLEKRCRPQTADRLLTLKRLNGRLGFNSQTILGAEGGRVSIDLGAKLSEQTSPILFAALGRGALKQLTLLELSFNRIGNAGLKSLSEALASGALPSLTYLNLWNNEIGDVGMKSFSEALASGALKELEQLYLLSNQIGDAGLASLSEALASGVLANLKDIYVDDKHMDHPQLKQACNRRNITIH